MVDLMVELDAEGFSDALEQKLVRNLEGVAEQYLQQHPDVYDQLAVDLTIELNSEGLLDDIEQMLARSLKDLAERYLEQLPDWDAFDYHGSSRDQAKGALLEGYRWTADHFEHYRTSEVPGFVEWVEGEVLGGEDSDG